MPEETKVKVGGIISNDHLARISVMGVPDRPGTAAALLAVFGETGVNVSFIVQCIDQRGQDHIVFCVDRSDLEVSLRLTCEVQAELCASTIGFDPQVASVGIHGPDFKERPGIASSMFAALAAMQINIQAISTSLSTITVVIAADRLSDAIKALQTSFELP
jgi:aspartate kinase